MSNEEATLRVLNRQVERNNELEAELFKASWERMVLYAAIYTARALTDPYYFSSKLEHVSDGEAFEQFRKELWG